MSEPTSRKARAWQALQIVLTVLASLAILAFGIQFNPFLPYWMP